MISTSLQSKMKVSPDTKVSVINPPPGSDSFLGKVEKASAGKVNDGLILAFAADKKALIKVLERILPFDDARIKLWICYPKKTSPQHVDLTRNSVWELGSKYLLRPVSQVSLNNDWSALRLRLEGTVTPKAKDDIPGIDHKNRTVNPPEELLAALKKSGLAEKFSKLSFTHKKEHVEAIVSARKPETRARRIRKCIEMLNL